MNGPILPPERPLRDPQRMLDSIVSGVAPAPSGAPRRQAGWWRYAGAAAAVLVVAVLAFQVVGWVRGAPPADPSVSPTATAPASPTPTVSPTPTAGPTPSPTATPVDTASPEPTDDRPTGPVARSVPIGETVSTRYFDVAVLTLETDQDGLAWGVQVRVCYRAPHPDANDDGTTRTSIDPWSLSVLDGEGPDPSSRWVKASELPGSGEWQPTYQTRLLRVGECNVGWIGVEPGNPDLMIPDVRWAPADFGDEIVWTRS